MLTFFCCVVLLFFSVIQLAIEKQLKNRSITSVTLIEVVFPAKGAEMLPKLAFEQNMWADHYRDARVFALIQSTMSASKNRTNFSVFCYDAKNQFFTQSTRASKAPNFWYIKASPDEELEKFLELQFQDHDIIAYQSTCPDWLKGQFPNMNMLFIPLEAFSSISLQGYTSWTKIELNDVEHVEDFLKHATAFYAAENRAVQISSGVELLRDLQRIKRLQNISRICVLLGVGMILAITLGSVAWLEYRQDAYLLALLRSFGASSWVLLLHTFLENLVLVLGGVGIVLLSWSSMYSVFLNYSQSLGGYSLGEGRMAYVDMAIIVSAGVLGVLFSMVPVAFGLRKQVGLILQ